MIWLDQFFKFLASLRLAVTLLVVLGIAFAVGTFIESYHGTAAAQVFIYRTPWMTVLLFLTALNLLSSALSRLPWKKKHVGFLTTHLGIILILSGSLVSQAFGIEGQLIIPEGNTEARMTLTEPVLEIFALNSHARGIYTFKPAAFSWHGRKELKTSVNSSLKVFLLADYPKAKLVEEVKPGDQGSPALHVHLKGSMAENEVWLLLDDPSRNEINLGPAVIRFTKEPLKESKITKSETGVLHFNFESGTEAQIEVIGKNIGKQIQLKGTPYRVQIERIIRDAIVEGNQLLDRSDQWQNPAVELILKGKGVDEKHTVFSKFPEFPTLHGMAPSEAHVRIAYEMEGMTESPSARELRFVWQADGLPLYQVKKQGEPKKGNVEIGRATETGWMDFKFTVDTYYEKANSIQHYEPLPGSSQDTGALPVLHLELEKGTDRKTLWIPQGEMLHVNLDGKDYHIMYGLRTKPIGFQIELKDFMMDTDPGTERPASFKSAVVLKDSAAGIKREQIIQMNEPLKYKGFKVFQTAYQQSPGQPDTSIFTVAKDPGNPLKYAGAIIMVSGILLLFYVKSFSTLKGGDPKMRTK